MRSGRLLRGFGGAMNLHRQLVETQLKELAQLRASDAEDYMARAKPTGLLGDGRIANGDDLFKAGLFGNTGLVIGGYQGRLLKYDGDAPLLTFLRTGGGKGVCYIQPNLAECSDRSFFVNDLKDGELAWSSAMHRAKKLGHKVIILDPYGVLKGQFKSTNINPFQILFDLEKDGKVIDSEFEELAHVLLPNFIKSNENEWVRKGAQKILSLYIEYLFRCEKWNCNL
ncbi:MAG: type IV secretory system conjugative DNA transfer family protein, partial [Caulobacterales bacterium]|nr:type IV secretory system conjugative DNA transfer family protein [Caulobacterales bacterium]